MGGRLFLAATLSLGLALAGCGKANEAAETGSTVAASESVAVDSTSSEEATAARNVFLGDIVLGSTDAPITIIEYASMTCSHCASFHNNTFPDVKKRLIDTGMVRFEMQPFPLDQIALRGHALARALPKNKYFPMISMLLKDIDRWARNPDPLAALSQMARLAGMSTADFDAVIGNRDLLEAIVEMRQKAHKSWEIQSTPSFVVNDKTIISGDLSYEDFAAKINATDA